MLSLSRRLQLCQKRATLLARKRLRRACRGGCIRGRLGAFTPRAIHTKLLQQRRQLRARRRQLALRGLS
eukprot:19692-Chlamydomonas_euryale.AAC.1